MQKLLIQKILHFKLFNQQKNLSEAVKGLLYCNTQVKY